MLVFIASLARASECTGDVELVLVDPVAYERANDSILDGILTLTENVGGSLGKVISFPLTIGSTSDAWDHAQGAIQSWMSSNGVEGTVWSGPADRTTGWLYFDVQTGTLTESRLLSPNDPVVPWDRVDLAIHVRVESPKQAVRALTGRGLGLLPTRPRERANYAVLEALAPWMQQQHMGAFVHLGAGHCS